MNLPPLTISTKLQIQKSAHEVYEAIADPAKMSQYFISDSNGRMEAGKTLTWAFPEFPDSFPVRVVAAEPGKNLAFYWDGDDGKELLVDIRLTAVNPSETLVSVTEKSRENDKAGLKWFSGNAAGWANFLACLKAYLEYGINLRKGAFAYMQAAPEAAVEKATT